MYNEKKWKIKLDMANKMQLDFMSIALPLFSHWTQDQNQKKTHSFLMIRWWCCCCCCWILLYHFLLNASALFRKSENSKFQVNFVNTTFVFYCVDCLLRCSFFYSCLTEGFILALAPVFVPIMESTHTKIQTFSISSHRVQPLQLTYPMQIAPSISASCIVCSVHCALFWYVRV